MEPFCGDSISGLRKWACTTAAGVRVNVKKARRAIPTVIHEPAINPNIKGNAKANKIIWEYRDINKYQPQPISDISFEPHDVQLTR